MGDKISTILLAGITAVTAVVIVTHRQSATFVRALGGTYVSALREISHAAG